MTEGNKRTLASSGLSHGVALGWGIEARWGRTTAPSPGPRIRGEGRCVTLAGNTSHKSALPDFHFRRLTLSRRPSRFGRARGRDGRIVAFRSRESCATSAGAKGDVGCGVARVENHPADCGMSSNRTTSRLPNPRARVCSVAIVGLPTWPFSRRLMAARSKPVRSATSLRLKPACSRRRLNCATVPSGGTSFDFHHRRQNVARRACELHACGRAFPKLVLRVPEIASRRPARDACLLAGFRGLPFDGSLGLTRGRPSISACDWASS